MANNWYLALAEPAPVKNGAATVAAGGALAAGHWALAVMAWMDSAESSYLRCGANVRSLIQDSSDPLYTLSSYGNAATANYWNNVVTSLNDKITVSWTAPTLNGVAVDDVDHYSLYYQYDGAQANVWDWTVEHRKVAVTGYSDGNIPPGVLTAELTDASPLYTDATTGVVRFDHANDYIYVQGDLRHRLPPGRTFVVSGSSNNDATFTVDTHCWLVFTLFGAVTVIPVTGDIAQEVVYGNEGIIITYKLGPLVTNSAALPGFDWGVNENILLSIPRGENPRLGSRLYRSSSGQLGLASQAIERTLDEITIVLGGSSVASREEWNQIMLWHKLGCRLLLLDQNDSGEYGLHGHYFGRISEIGHLGHAQKYRGLTHALTFMVESEA